MKEEINLSAELSNLANSSAIWVIAFFVSSVVIFQAVIFIRIAKTAAPDVGLSSKDVKTAIRTGFISSLGPSFGIAIVIISLITLLGSPVTLMRIGIIGSAATESAAAQIGAEAFGVILGGDGFNAKAFATVVWTMCLGGMGWLVVTLLFTKSLGKTEKAIKKRYPKTMASVALAAMLGAFGYLTAAQMVRGISFAIAAVVSLMIMVFIMAYAEKKNIAWLKEWALGISMIFGMVGGSIVVIFM